MIPFRLVLMVRAQKATPRRAPIKGIFMKYLWRMTIALLVTGVLTPMGCQSMTSKGKAGADLKTKNQPSHDAAAMDDYQGFYMTVKVDGKKTVMSQKEDGMQIWTVPACSATPTIMFTMHAKKLGALKGASITISTLKKGKVDPSNFYQYAGGIKFLPSRKLKLNIFNHFHSGKMDQNVKKLPQGSYRINIQVNGGKSWDRQYIDTEVK